jgi:hypothetical protein
MRLVLTIAAVDLSFTPLGDVGPYPMLIEVASLRIAAKAGAAAGLGTSEPPDASVTLENSGKRASAIIGVPLRAPAKLYDGDVLAFEGIVSAIKFSRIIELTIQS